eukprot:6621367-Pyramimonas_sp.AAC.1
MKQANLTRSLKHTARDTDSFHPLETARQPNRARTTIQISAFSGAWSCKCGAAFHNPRDQEP